MSLTKEIISHVENEVQSFTNESLVIYYRTYKDLNEKYPNSYFRFRVTAASSEIFNRGIEDSIMEDAHV